MYEWAKEMNCAVTVCDTKGIILYMNDKACQTFAKYGNLIGKISLPVTTHSHRRKYMKCYKPAAVMPIQ